jgi:hypothetical protein
MHDPYLVGSGAYLSMYRRGFVWECTTDAKEDMLVFVRGFVQSRNDRVLVVVNDEWCCCAKHLERIHAICFRSKKDYELF